jgi:hypothetical protein
LRATPNKAISPINNNKLFYTQISIEGIRAILKECWKNIKSNDSKIDIDAKLMYLQLAKECNESILRMSNEMVLEYMLNPTSHNNHNEIDR